VKGLLLALTVGLVLLIAGPAAADTSSLGGQSAAQSAGNLQLAGSSATSTQYNPSNENISVRVLSPGDDGDVSQSNNSSAESGALNLNGTGQKLSQDQSGSGSGCCDAAQQAMQQAAQWAGNAQKAESNAESTQKNPSNENISVRVLSPGKNGSVDQSNNSTAQSFAGNLNLTKQDTHQSQGSSDGKVPITKDPTSKYPSKSSSDSQDGRTYDPCGCGSGSKQIQAAGQDALNLQKAKSNATSTQIDPSNENISVRVLSPGSDGDVSQSNNSTAQSFAGNANLTKQKIEQTQSGSSGGEMLVPLLSKLCGCSGHSTGIQAAAQQALNVQGAFSNAESKQIHPQNVNKSLRLKDGVEKRPPKDCGCKQPPKRDGSYDPSSGGGNYGSPGEGDPYGSSNEDPSYGSSKEDPSYKPAPDDSGGNVTQSNNSEALSKALNLNALGQFLRQSQGSGGDVVLM
jgi:hypothetical protein